MEIHSIPELFEEYRARFLPDKAHDLEGAVQLRLSGEEGGDWVLEVRDRVLSITSGLHATPIATIACRAKDWIAISTGRANPMALVLTGRMKVKGSISTVTRFQHLFRMD